MTTLDEVRLVEKELTSGDVKADKIHALSKFLESLGELLDEYATEHGNAPKPSKIAISHDGKQLVSDNSAFNNLVEKALEQLKDSPYLAKRELVNFSDYFTAGGTNQLIETLEAFGITTKVTQRSPQITITPEIAVEKIADYILNEPPNQIDISIDKITGNLTTPDENLQKQLNAATQGISIGGLAKIMFGLKKRLNKQYQTVGKTGHLALESRQAANPNTQIMEQLSQPTTNDLSPEKVAELYAIEAALWIETKRERGHKISANLDLTQGAIPDTPESALLKHMNSGIFGGLQGRRLLNESAETKEKFRTELQNLLPDTTCKLEGKIIRAMTDEENIAHWLEKNETCGVCLAFDGNGGITAGDNGNVPRDHMTFMRHDTKRLLTYLDMAANKAGRSTPADTGQIWPPIKLLTNQGLIKSSHRVDFNGDTVTILPPQDQLTKTLNRKKEGLNRTQGTRSPEALTC